MSKIHILNGDCVERMSVIPDSSVHLVVTDPPYFIDGMGDKWDHEKLSVSKNKAGVVGSMPVGMKFDRQQSYNLQSFMKPVSQEIMRVLKPGGFFISFSQARLIHRMAVAMEDEGFEIRDLIGWVRNGQAKAQKQEHHVRKKLEKGLISEEEATKIIASMEGRKTPQLRPELEPMVLGMKPLEGTFVDNWIKHQTGLVDMEQSLDGLYPSNVMRVPKPNKEEKGEGNEHLTVKPVRLISHLVELFSRPGQTVLDPFMGSGSHGLAAMMTSRNFIGCELEDIYYDIATDRMINAGASFIKSDDKERFLAY